jgi:uncharacterized protein (DUF169 family)
MPIPLNLLDTLTRVGLTSRPVAIAFLDSPPPGLEPIGRSQPASCSYWKEASEGRAFFTTADDHANCPVGAFTHGVELSAGQAQELQSLVGTMIQLEYLKSDEVPQIPRRQQPLRVAAYAPLDKAEFDPDVVVFRGTARQIMLLSEAARRAGVFEAGAVMGRPACAMLPQAIGTASSVASLGCIGNRVYTGLADDELYLGVPGPGVRRVLDELTTILAANTALETFHRERAASALDS